MTENANRSSLFLHKLMKFATSECAIYKILWIFDV